MIANRSRLASAALAIAFLAAPFQALAQNAYTVQSIGTHGNGTYPQHVNDAGDVAGYHYPSGYQRSFLYRNGVFTDIGTLGGSYSWTADINASGVVVGASYLTNNNSYHAFLFDGVLRDLGTLGGNYSQASAINADGDVVGWADGQAFLYSGGIMRRLLDLLPAGSGWSYLYEAVDINDAGQITGRGYHSSLGHRAFLFTPATATTPATIVTFGPANSYPQWINASGQIAGREYSSGDRVFLYTPGPGSGTYTVVPGLGGTATYSFDLNDAGQIVGYSYLPGNTAYHAFLFSGGQTVDLDPAVGSSNYSYARAINNSGVIVGYSNSYGQFAYADGAVRRINDLVNGCAWSAGDASVINNAGQIAGNGQSSVGHRGFRMTPAPSQTATALTASNASGGYRRPVQLQARVVAACSAAADRTVSFEVNGTVRGTAQTDGSGWARLTTTLQDVVVGTYTDGIAASFVGDDEFDASSGLATLTVFRATPIITWTPAAMVEGTPLGPDQLNATADTTGTFFYSPNAGTLLGAGLRRLFLSFQPADTTNYNSAGVQALLAVRASNPAVSFTAAESAGLGGTWMELRALNNAGQAAGYSYLPGNSAYRAIAFSNGVTTDLGTLGGQYSMAEDLNDAGQVTGWAYTANNSAQHAFLYSGGSMLDIGSLLPSGAYSVGRAINASGDVALYGRSGSWYEHAFLYTASNGSMTDLGTLNAGQYSYPLDINASRQVVGYSYTTSGCYHAFLATTSGMQDLGTLGGTCSQAVAINDSGHVVGWAYDSSGRQRAFVFKDGTMVDLGTLGGDYAAATAINEQGVVTGWSYIANNSRTHAFRYANGVLTDLGAVSYDSRGNDVNDTGDVVGWSYSVDGAQAAILHRSGTLHDVNALINVGETAGVSEARKINDAGQILARGSSTTTRWYVLTPTTLAASSLSLSAAAGVYKGTTTLTATLSIADPAGAFVSFKLNGTVVGTAFADADGVATLQGVSLGTLNAGTHVAAATASFAGNAGYSGSTAAADVVIAKATPTITWPQPAAITYGTLLSPTQLNATTTVAGQFTFTPAVGALLSAGTQTLHVSFAPADNTNYNQAEADVSLIVLKATPAINWANPASIVYGTLLGAAQLNATSPINGTFAYSPAAGTQLNAGSAQTLSVVFTPADTVNYNSANRSVSITVLKATPSVAWSNPADIVYGTLLGASQLNATSPVAGTFTYSPASGTQLNAGNGQTLTVNFTPDDANNYNPASRTVAINVLKATPAVSWSNPADIVYGTLLGDAQLNATAPVPGTFTYAPAAGTRLNAGSGQTLTVNFAPADTANYVAASAAVLLTVQRAPSSVVVAGGIFLFDGQAHGATGQVLGVGGVIATPAISYVPGSTPPVDPGIYQVVASFAGDANHLPSSNSAASIVINAEPTIEALTGAGGPVALGTSTSILASFDDSATGDSHTCTFDWSDGTTPSTAIVSAGATTCSAPHSYAAAGVYTVLVTVQDDDGYAVSSAFKYIVVYDPNAGFVTGGGWILSPEGAYAADASLTGKAHFGFVSKYKKGMSVPTGTTEFEFEVANLKFQSSQYEWLVVSGARAQYKGTGTVNGAGAFGFLLTTVDGQVIGGGGTDMFRIKIWDVASGAIVYDNLLGAGDELSINPQALGGGSIVIHSK